MACAERVTKSSLEREELYGIVSANYNLNMSDPEIKKIIVAITNRLYPPRIPATSRPTDEARYLRRRDERERKPKDFPTTRFHGASKVGTCPGPTSQPMKKKPGPGPG